MGQAETKIFEDAPPWTEAELLKMTDLTEEVIDACWRIWAKEPNVHHNKLKEEGFYHLLDLAEEKVADRAQAKKLFELLDRDDDNRLEFDDTMLFLFSMEDELDMEQKLRRSFHFYDRKGNKKITKEEMVETLDLLGLHEMEHDEKGKVIIPESVENLFSLMDFAKDGAICESEFIKTTKHYRNLGKYLTIELLEDGRRGMQAMVKAALEQARQEKEEEEKKKDKDGGGESRRKMSVDVMKANLKDKLQKLSRKNSEETAAAGATAAEECSSSNGPAKVEKAVTEAVEEVVDDAEEAAKKMEKAAEEAVAGKADEKK